MVITTVQDVVKQTMIVAKEKQPMEMIEPSWWTDPSYDNYGRKIEACCTICNEPISDFDETDIEQCEDCRDDPRDE